MRDFPTHLVSFLFDLAVTFKGVCSLIILMLGSVTVIAMYNVWVYGVGFCLTFANSPD